MWVGRRTGVMSLGRTEMFDGNLLSECKILHYDS